MPYDTKTRICISMNHPIRKKLGVGNGTVCLVCNICRGARTSRPGIFDKFYHGFLFNRRV